ILFWRQRKLRLRLDEVLEDHGKQNDALHRELLELKRQLANLQQSPVAPSHPVSEARTETHPAVPPPVLHPLPQTTPIEQRAATEKPVSITTSAEAPPVVEKPAVPEKPVIAEPTTPAVKHEVPAVVSP